MGRILLASAMGACGLFMMLHGLGLVDASLLNPNPDAPPWVFALLGLILMLGAFLILNTARPQRPSLVNRASYTVVALAFLLMHWLVFASTGGTCSLSTGGLILWLDTLLCRGVMALAVIVLDLILLLVVLASITGKRGA
ncbi:MAG: hypothetical protein U1E15_10535 [Hyphomicrobiales bacterium]